MRWILLALVAVWLLPACSETEKKCAEYARLELKCQSEPDEATREAAKKSCMAAHKKDPEDHGLAEAIKDKAKCASKNSDCASYTACTSRLSP